MAKIKITEGELRQLIGESVVSVLNEARYNTYGVNWDDLTDDQKQNYASMYGNKAGAAQYVDANGNPYQGGGYAPGTGYTRQYNMDKMRDFYNKEQERFAKNSRRNGITPELYQKVSKENSYLKTQLSQAQNLNNGYKSAISQISQAIGGQIAEAGGAPAPIDSSWSGAPAANTPTADQRAAMTVKSAVPNLDQILKSINDMKTKVTQLTKANQQLTSTNKNLTSQNQSLAKKIQNGQNQKLASPIAVPKATAQATTRQTGLSRPGAAAPGTAQA